jgi:hypothetical protein
VETEGGLAVKLVLCRSCQDVFKLVYDKRTCLCGKTWGRYLEDGLHAVYGGESAIPLGFANDSLATAIAFQPTKVTSGFRFEAFVISKKCATMVKED